MNCIFFPLFKLCPPLFQHPANSSFQSRDSSDSNTNQLSFSCNKTRKQTVLAALEIPPVADKDQKQDAIVGSTDAKEISAEAAVAAV